MKRSLSALNALRSMRILWTRVIVVEAALILFGNLVGRPLGNDLLATIRTIAMPRKAKSRPRIPILKRALP